MNYSTPIPSRQPKSRRVRKRRKKAETGRFYIFCIFVWLRTIDAATLHSLYPELPIVYQRYLILSLVISATWNTGLLLAIWFRQQWAKYILAGSLLLTVASILAMLPGLPESTDPQKQLTFTLGVAVVYLPVALLLILSKSIQKLTFRKEGKMHD
ncbi:MAG: hypothetical protein WCO68_07995 [Verrucomicrobiota bacterium]